MLRHRGRSRTNKHNLQLAAMFSLVAGQVNITGFLTVRQLTTNVTGHFAYFAEAVSYRDLSTALHYGLFILAFLAGAFLSNILLELGGQFRLLNHYTIPVTLEMVILFAAAMTPVSKAAEQPELFACSLLLAMGLQNALVTNVSNAAVRTTHLTGLFTDIGIELSQLLFYRQPEDRRQLLRSIWLRSTIVLFFFAGCIVGGMLFPSLGSAGFFLCVGCLAIALFKDAVRLQWIRFRRRRYK